jgi:recombination protein RecT
MSNLIQSVNGYFGNNIERIQEACTQVKVNEQVMDVCQIISNTQKLQACSPASIVGAVITASRLGVSLDPNMKHAYLIPYGSKANLEISYLGLIDVASRMGDISISAHEVYSEDVFEPKLGAKKELNHIPVCFGERGVLVGVYAIAYFPDGTIDFETLDMIELEKCRKASKNPNGSVYKLWEKEMYKKSAVRRLFKRLPKNKDIARLQSYDEKTQIGEDVSDIINIDGVEIPQEQSAQQTLEGLI